MINDIQPARRAGKTALNSSVPAATESKTPGATTQPFRTPEDVAAAQTLQPPSGLHVFTNNTSPQRASGRFSRFRLRWPPTKEEWIAFAIIILLIGGGTAWLKTHPSAKPVATAHKIAVVAKKPPAPTIVPSTLSGLPVSPSVNKLPVTGVMIENSTFARPQSGLSQAGVVFEAIAEGGVTRFLALYQDTAPASVGPIRSVRPYYELWALGFDAAIAHVGGSPEALADINTWGVRNLDEFANSGSYHRITTRAAPHNVYTSIALLNQLEAAKGYTTSTYTGFPRKAESPAKTPTAGTIHLTLSGPVYDASYTYTAATNSYARSEGGTPQTDANTNTQISPKVVIALVVPESRGALDSSGAYYSIYQAVGSGAVYVFQDGTVTTGQWAKSSNNVQLSFTDSAGQPIKLNPGQTWLTAVTKTSDVSYTP